MPDRADHVSLYVQGSSMNGSSAGQVTQGDLRSYLAFGKVRRQDTNTKFSTVEFFGSSGTLYHQQGMVCMCRDDSFMVLCVIRVAENDIPLVYGYEDIINSMVVSERIMFCRSFSSWVVHY
uniref:Longin domain-containing protein n=1 Tax=Ascaris lumbricoides TaxID=6252 RepID=A0A0M3HNT3_ASCLU